MGEGSIFHDLPAITRAGLALNLMATRLFLEDVTSIESPVNSIEDVLIHVSLKLRIEV